ncbi:MAG TPA: hypothetical protein VFR97_08440 [Capillimicrobium sp.]|nr:hypothetical protein [Capillimicrobium sp.]
MRRIVLVGLAGIVGATALGCGGDGDAGRDGGDTAAAGTKRAPAAEREPAGPKRPPAPRCEPGAANCAAAAGSIIAMERIDPDGDGDLHVIVAGGDVTFPGITVLDVSAALRPARDPRIGEWAAGAGPVYAGSYGQRQIEVDEVVFARK